MEQETKYLIEKKGIADQIWAEAIIGFYGDISNPETVEMDAAYLDSEDKILNKNHISLRARKEGSSCFATIKWGSGSIIGGLHEHQEVNIPVNYDDFLNNQNLDIFTESIDGKKMTELLEGKKLEVMFKTQFSRRRVKIKTGKSLVELALDEGYIISGSKKEPISEMEIELYMGNLSDVLKLSESIARRYRLVPGDKSKYARAMALLYSKDA